MKKTEYIPGDEIYRFLSKAMASLEIPKQEEIETGSKKIFERDISDLASEINYINELLGKIEIGETAKHVENVALKGMEVADYLGIGNIEVSERGNVRQAMFISGLVHDKGKISPSMRENVKKSERVRNGSMEQFTQKDMQNMKRHVLVSAELEEDPFIRGIIARHHIYQKNRYPKISLFPYDEKKYGERSPEVIYLSKLLAIVDCYDRAQDKERVMEIYARLKLNRCDRLPRMKGKKLIDMLYAEGIF